MGIGPRIETKAGTSGQIGAGIMAALICNRCGHEGTKEGPCEYTYPSFNGKPGAKCNGTVKAHTDRVPWTHRGGRK